MKFKPYMLVVILLVLFLLFSFRKSGYDVQKMVGSGPGAMLTPGPDDDSSYMADAMDSMMMSRDSSSSEMTTPPRSSSQGFMCSPM